MKVRGNDFPTLDTTTKDTSWLRINTLFFFFWNQVPKTVEQRLTEIIPFPCIMINNPLKINLMDCLYLKGYLSNLPHSNRVSSQFNSFSPWWYLKRCQFLPSQLNSYHRNRYLMLESLFLENYIFCYKHIIRQLLFQLSSFWGLQNNNKMFFCVWPYINLTFVISVSDYFNVLCPFKACSQ